MDVWRYLLGGTSLVMGGKGSSLFCAQSRSLWTKEEYLKSVGADRKATGLKSNVNGYQIGSDHRSSLAGRQSQDFIRDTDRNGGSAQTVACPEAE